MSTRIQVCSLLSAVAISVGFPAFATAQRGQDASVVGTIRDTSGAVLPGATVTVSGAPLMGERQSTTTDAQGTYRIPFLPAGEYAITAELIGFSPAPPADLELRPGLTFTADLVLQLAAINETVDVEVRQPTVDVSASSAPTLIDRQLLDSLPLPRTPFSGAGTVADAINLAPGVVQSVALGGTFLANPLSLDGTSGTEPGYGQPTAYPNPNWIEALQIVSIGADAQYGEYSGALVNAITRSGSNRFSGLGDYWITRRGWTSDNRESLAPPLQERFRPIEIIDRWDSDFQLGGPLVKDRLWFFAGGEVFRNAYWPTTFNGAVKAPDDPYYDATERKFIAKLTNALSSALRVQGYIEHGLAHADGANAGPLIAPDATAMFDRRETMWNVRGLWTLSPRAFVELHHGGHKFSGYFGPPDSRRSGPASHYDTLTGVTSGNPATVQNWQDRPIATSGHLTYFLGGATGTHEFRTGFEYEHASSRTFSGYVGGRLFSDIGGEPNEVELWDGATYRPTQSRKTLYAQDSWHVASRVTLNLGVRVSGYHGEVPGDADAFRNGSLSPRVGAAFDLAGDHRSVLRAHYGRYHDALVTSYYDFLDPLSQTPDIVATVVGPNQFAEKYRLPTTAQASIDPSTRFPFVDEYLVGIERQLPSRISITAQYIKRAFKDAIGFTDTARTWLPTEGADPGPDGRRGTLDDGGAMTVYFDEDPSKSAPLLTNPPAYRSYHGLQFIAVKPYARNIQFQASYVWARTTGNYNNAAYSNAANNDLGVNGSFVNPNRLINTDGRTPQDFTHDVKLLGTYRIPSWGGLNVSGVYRYQSGRPWARSAGGFGTATEVGAIFVEPRATRQLPAVSVLDLRVDKTWKPPSKAATVGAFVDAFNVWNQGVALRVANLSGPNLGVPVQWLEPRSLRAGIRLMF